MNKKYLIKEIYRNNKLNLFLAFVGVILESSCSIGIAFILKSFLDLTMNGNMEDLLKLLIISIVFIFILCISLIVENFFCNKFYCKGLKQYKDFICKKILDKDIGLFQKEETSNYLSALSNDVNSIEMNYLNGIINLGKQYFLLSIGLIAMFYLSWKLAICVLFACMLSFLVSALFGKSLSELEKQISDRNENFMNFIKDLFSGFAVIKSFKVSTKVYDRFTKNNSELEDTKKKRKNKASIIMIVSNFTSFVITFSIFGFGTYLAIKGEITAGVVIAFVQLLNYILGPIQQIGPLTSNKKAALKIIDKAEGRILGNGEHDKVKSEYCEFKHSIVYEHVFFQIGEKEILKNVSLTFQKEKSYAIVGPSGSGKSTILNLLLGYHECYDGKIKIDDVALSDMKLDDVYDNVSTIQQNVFIFNDTIENNITMYQNLDESRVHDAIDKSGLRDLIKEKGKDYKCGENGVNLSGGEKQRISIARALLRDTKILLMDEGTAALDNTTSYQIESNILSIEGIMKIIITHKLNEKLLERYDAIIVLKDGLVKEIGNFEELMKNKSYFYSLYTLEGEN